MKKILLLLLVFCFLTGCSASQEPVPSEEAVTSSLETSPLHISPLPATVSLTSLNDCTVAVSLKEGDAYVDDTGAMQMKVTVYAYDLYDLVDISRLQVGDFITIRQQEVAVTALEKTAYGSVQINGGLDVGGYELVSDDSGVFYETGYSDVKAWQEIGEAVIRVSPDFVYTDHSDLDHDPVVYYPGDFLMDGTGIDYHFTPHNTTIVIEQGFITAMNRTYTP